jgi:hypothetical protein
MDTLILTLHSWVRWLVVIVTAAAFVYALYGLATRREYDKNATLIMRIFSSLIGVQWLLGLILFVMRGQFSNPSYIEHATTMTGVVIIAHLYLPFKKRPSMTRYGIMLAVVVVVSVLVFVGVARLPQGWMPTVP